MEGFLSFLIALIFGLSGPGASGFESSGSREETLRPQRGAPPASDEPSLPPILLHSDGGVQQAALRAYSLEQDGGGVSGMSGDDGPPATTVVRPGDVVSVSVRGVEATQRLLVARKGSCDGDAAAATLLDRDEPRWRVELAPGEYVLEVTVLRFRTARGTGEQTGVLGLRVDPDGERAVESSAISC